MIVTYFVHILSNVRHPQENASYNSPTQQSLVCEGCTATTDSPLTGERGGVLLEQSELVAQLHHGLADDGLLVDVLGLEVGQRHLGRLLVSLQHGSQSGNLLSLGGQQRLELYHLKRGSAGLCEQWIQDRTGAFSIVLS